VGVVKKRRNTEVFSLSFLDVICCGFGAVILFYTVISAQSSMIRTKETQDLAAQVSKIEEEVLEGARNLVRLRNTLQQTESETAAAASRATRLIEELQRKREESSIYDSDTLAKRERIEKLKADVKALEESTRRLEASAQVPTPNAERVAPARASITSRRYLTGLALRGKRVLVLVDRSASMLDEDLVNVIRLRNSPEPARQAAAKWRRAVDITNWIVAQVPQGSQFQVYAFNTRAEPLVQGTGGKWLPAGDNAQLDRVSQALDALVPQEGTSLLNAFRAIREVNPEPDQVVLITDGLPTQGATPPALRKFVDVAARARLFDEAARSITLKAPIDVVLLPMKGDLPASHRFWMLARSTKGAFVMPSPDWP
jgi:hypothetical protein